MNEKINPSITPNTDKPLKPEKPLTPGTSGEGHPNLSPVSPFTSPVLSSNIISSGKEKFTSNGKLSFITRPDKSYSILKISENGVEEVWASLGTEVDSILIDKISCISPATPLIWAFGIHGHKHVKHEDML